ncbi:MAG: membrane protein insertase YidC [Bacteroidales bacterium]|nr:membrane protein insertase YidC [Bacteroidales bacterium]
MDRNTIFGLLLIFGILIIYSVWMAPDKAEQEARKLKQDSIVAVYKEKQDSINRVIAYEKLLADSLMAQEAASIETVREETDEDSSDPTQLLETHIDRSKLGVFTNSSLLDEKCFILENDFVKLRISSKGAKVISAQLKQYHTYDTLPLILFDEESSVFGIEFFYQNKLINTNSLHFQLSSDNNDSVFVNELDSASIALRLYTDASGTSFNNNSYIEYVYTLKGDDYMMDFTMNFVNMNTIMESNTGYLNLEWSADMLRQEKSLDNERNESTIYYKYFRDDVDYISERSDDEESLNTKLKWISFKERFFTATLIAKDNFLNADIKTLTREETTDEHYNKSMFAIIGIPLSAASKQSFDMNWYFGPNKYKILKKYDLSLERQIPLGWSFFLLGWINIYAVIPVFDYLGSFDMNYGIIILILTLLLKTVLFPIAYKTYVSSAKMRVLKPEIDEIGKKFPKKEDSMKKQQATMALYKKAGVNPMAGCVPMLLQMPILIALFRFFPSSIELRQQAFLWAHDLSSYDSIWTFPGGFSIPFYGDHISLFTLLMTVSTIIYTKVNSEMMGSTSAQMPGMKTMMYLMPLMFLGIFNNYASGLSYYYFLANIITFAQVFVIRKFINEEKILLRIQQHKKKPAKQSNFQKRLETMAKKKGYTPKK